MAWEPQISDDITLDFDIVHRITNADHNELKNRDLPDQHPISSITGLEDTLTKMQETIDSMGGTDTEVTEAISKMEESVANLEKSMAENVTNLENSIAENKTKIENLETAVEQNKTDVTNLSTSVTENKADIEHLENTIAQQAADISTLNTTVEELEEVKLDGETMTNEEIQALWKNVMA